jgi:hypothetical protein
MSPFACGLALAFGVWCATDEEGWWALMFGILAALNGALWLGGR